MKNLLTNLNKPCLECGGEAHYEDGGAFVPHVMYNPETGEPIEVSSPEEHTALAEQGFLSEAEMNQMAIGGQHMQNGMESMQKNINSYFKKLSKNRNNMFKDATAPMNQDTDSYGALKLDNFKDYVKQNVEDVMMQEALQSYTDAKGKIDMVGIEAAMGTPPQGGMPQPQMAAYGGGNFGMGDSNFDITPWANVYGQQLQENAFNTGALGSMFGSAAENIAGNIFDPQYKTKTKTKLLFNKKGVEGGDEFIEGIAKLDRDGNVKRERDWVDSKGVTHKGDIKMTKSKIKRDWFSPGRREDKKDYRQWKKGQRNEKRRNARNASNQAIFDARVREQVGEGDLSNIDMPTLQTDINELLTNPYDMSNYNWKDQFNLYSKQFGGVPEQYGGGVNPYLEMYHEGGNLPSHNHSTSVRNMSDMVTPSGEQIFLQGWQSGQNNKAAWQNPIWSYGPRHRAKRLSADVVEGSDWTNYGNPAWGGSEPQFGSTWDNQPKIPGVNGYVDAMGVWHGDPTGNPENFDQYVANRGDWREGATVVEEDKSKKKTKTASEKVEEIQDGNVDDGNVDDGDSDDSSLEKTYKKGERREWDGEKWVTISDDGNGGVDNSGGNQGNIFFAPDQYGYGMDPRWGNNLFRGTMRNMRPRRGAMPIMYDPSKTALREYDYKTKTGLMGQAFGWGPRKEHTRMRFSHAGDAPWREKEGADVLPTNQVVTNENANLGTIQAASAADQKALLEAELNAQRVDAGNLRPRGNDEFGRIDGSQDVYNFGQEKYGGPQYFPEQFPQAAMYPVFENGGDPGDGKNAITAGPMKATGTTYKPGQILTEDDLAALSHQYRGMGEMYGSYVSSRPRGGWGSAVFQTLTPEQQQQLSEYMNNASLGQKVWEALPNWRGNSGASAVPVNSTLRPDNFANAVIPTQQFGGVPFPEQFPQAARYPQYLDGGPTVANAPLDDSGRYPEMGPFAFTPTAEPSKIPLWMSDPNVSIHPEYPEPPTTDSMWQDEYNRDWERRKQMQLQRSMEGSYAMGGEYDLTEDEVAQILAAGGQIEYI